MTQPETQPNKAIAAGIIAVTTGLGFIVSAGTLHGNALLTVNAALVALDSVGSIYGVYRVRNKLKLK